MAGRVIYIYGLKDPRNDDIRYVGKTNNLKSRLRGHIYAKKKCYSASWVKSLTSVGVMPVMFLLEESDDKTWRERERFWIAHYRALGYKLTNMTEGGDGNGIISPELRESMAARMRGKKHSEATKKKMSASRSGENNGNYGKHQSEETKEKNRQAHLGKKQSEQAKKKLSDFWIGKPKPPTQRANIIAAKTGERNPRWGKKNTAEHNAKISAGNKGKTISAENIAKLVVANTGRQISEETRELMRQAKLGKPLSAEHRAKIGVSNTGKIVPPEVGEKISKSKKGKPGRSPTAETRTKIGDATRKRYALAKLEKDNLTT